MYHFMTKGSTLPILRLELIEDGRHDFHKFQNAIQNADITFTMVNSDTNITKIANGKCYIKKREVEGCEDQYVICYDWKKRDTNESGLFKGFVTIEFNAIKSDDETYPSGTLIAPIREDLLILIRDTVEQPQ